MEDDDLFLAFERLLTSEQADAIYAEWTRDCPDLPHSFRSIVGINLGDRYQCKHIIFPHFRRSKNVVDFYLSAIVFPKEMREFPKKIAASGWDLGQVKPNPTTGFSGTSDSHELLSSFQMFGSFPLLAHVSHLLILSTKFC